MSKYKKNKAAALKYNMEEDTAPVVIASGYGPHGRKNHRYCRTERHSCF